MQKMHYLNSIYLNKMLSAAIKNLLLKKNFAKSKYFYSTKKSPIDTNGILPLSVTLVLTVLKTHTFCMLFLILYLVNIFVFKPKRRVNKLILIYSLTKDQAVRDGSIKSLSNFLETKRIIEQSNLVTLIEIRKLMWNKKYKMARTTLDIPLAIYANDISIKSKICCWISMCKRFFKVVKLRGKNSDILNIAKEYIFDEVVYSALDPKKIKKLITTQNHVAYQPLVFEYTNIDAKKIMIWYSSNSVPIQYKNSKVKSFSINPEVYMSMKIDEHWVWTQEHRDYLSEFSSAKILVKKSLMFYEPEKCQNINKIYDVVIFDVTPYMDIKIVSDSIYTAREMTKFIGEILTCIEFVNKKYKKDYRVYLKHKRKPSKNHSLKYLNYIKEKVANNDITLVEPNQNLYDLISNSKLVIGFPFTSPVVIGRELGRPSIFYCSSNLLNSNRRNKKLLFLQSKASLYSYIEKELVKVK